jgi:hypothetical protein
MRTRTQRAPVMTLLGFAQDHGQRSRLKHQRNDRCGQKALSRFYFGKWIIALTRKSLAPCIRTVISASAPRRRSQQTALQRGRAKSPRNWREPPTHGTKADIYPIDDPKNIRSAKSAAGVFPTSSVPTKRRICLESMALLTEAVASGSPSGTRPTRSALARAKEVHRLMSILLRTTRPL